MHEKSGSEVEIIRVHIIKHLLSLLVLEGVRYVKSDLSQVDNDNDPVALTQRFFVVWLLRGEKEELKHVTHVHILADVCE